MIYKQDISRAFSDSIGKEGIDKTYFAQMLGQTEKAIAALRKHKESGDWPVLTIAERTDDLDLIEKEAEQIRANFATLVVVGMGGSSRGGSTLAALTKNPFVCKPTGTVVHFVENIDPVTSDQLLAALDLKTTLFLIVTKSGDTAETLAHLLVLMDAVAKKLGAPTVKNHFLGIASPGDNAMRRIAQIHHIRMLDHDPNLGGRFSVLSIVGLLPAKVAGVDIRAVRNGAQDVLRHTLHEPSPEPARGAALSVALNEKGKNVAVLMPYCDRLWTFTAWYQQLWAESLGKKHKGTTPLAALGATDQHSQLQMYLNGPRDKFLTLILLAQADKGAAIPQPPDASLAYLRNHTIGDLMDGEQRATAETLMRNKVPLRLFTLPELDATSLGALLMHFMLETMITAQLLGVNAFDQPAVEDSKRLARTYLMQTQK
jgi:glucose-6-phosphate isomerase